MEIKDRILLHVMAMLVIASVVLSSAMPAEAGIFDWLGGFGGFDGCWWNN